MTSAIVIPILIYLFAKKKPRRIIFSSIRFIKESQQKQRRKINIKNLILLLIRMLIILFIILAISRPAIKAPILKSSKFHPKTGIAVIVDNSYSMNYLVDTQTELEKAKSIAQKMNTIISENDQVLLLTLDEDRIKTSIIYGKIPAALIEEIKPASRISPLEDVLLFAQEKLKETHLPNKEIYFITDLQEYPLPEKLDIPVFFIPTSNIMDRNNISCQNAITVNEIVKKDLEKKITFELVNHSNRSQQDVIFKLFLDGNTIAEKVTDILPEQRKTENFTIDLQQPGWHSGYVEVKNERQTFDNRNYFCFHFNPDPIVAVITDLPQIPLVMETLLELYSNNIKIINSDNINLESLKQYDNIIVYGKSELSGRMEFILETFLKSNKQILFIADKGLSKEWQNFLERNFKMDFKKFLHRKTSYNISFANKYHPITNLLKSVESIGFNDFWSVSTNSGILIEAHGLPVAVEQNGSSLWLFDIASLQNPFLLDPAFPVFAYNTLNFLSDGNSESTSLIIGNRIKLTSPEIQLPDGNNINLSRDYYIPTDPGIYRTADKIYALNLDYSESDFKRFSKQKMKNLEILDENWIDDFLQSRYGFEIWKYLLIFVLILFILEML
ncbi:MAG: BatA domain-containing protein, partial [Candidatus Cloacimonetes bacterium]|nr:BatA domain-containing protein [Candidatus Cloacimonadota bacterium]